MVSDQNIIMIDSEKWVMLCWHIPKSAVWNGFGIQYW